MNIRKENGKRIADILEHTGADDVIIRTDNDWDLRIYHSDLNGSTKTIEMCSTIDFQGDILFDPLMKIALSLDNEGRIIEATPVYYISRTPFYTEEIYAEGNPDCWDPNLYKKASELDGRLSEWLDSIQIQRYLTKGEITKA